MKFLLNHCWEKKSGWVIHIKWNYSIQVCHFLQHMMPTDTKHHIRSSSLEDINHGHKWFREPKRSLSCLPGLGSLSPSRVRVAGADTSCLTPGLRLSSANGQSSPSVDSISITGTGGKVFSSAGTQTEDGVGGGFKQGNTCLILDYLFTVISQTYRQTHTNTHTGTTALKLTSPREPWQQIHLPPLPQSITYEARAYAVYIKQWQT